MTEECVNDNSDEEVEENLRDNDLEQEMENYSKASSTAFGPINIIRVVTPLHDTVVILSFIALVHN